MINSFIMLNFLFHEIKLRDIYWLIVHVTSRESGRFVEGINMKNVTVKEYGSFGEV